MAQPADKVDVNCTKLRQILRQTSIICTEGIKAILDSGFDINYASTHKNLSLQSDYDCYIHSVYNCGKGTTALHFAVDSNLKEVVRLLLTHHADVTCKNEDGYTPLRLAINHIKNMKTRKFNYNKEKKRSDEELIDILILSHIESKNTTNPSCKDGISHFHIACLIDNIQVVDFFLKSGVAVNETVSKTSYFYPGYSPLHFAVEYGSDILVEKLLYNGANVTLINANNMTPLTLMVENTVSLKDNIFMNDIKLQQKIERNDIIIKLLINKSNSSNLTNQVDQNGFSFFHASCILQDTVLAEKFMEIDLDINSCVNFDSKLFPGYTPLHFAAHNHKEMVMLLLKKGANILAKDANDETPFDLLAQRFELDDIYKVLNTVPVLKFIYFQDGTKLTDAIFAMKTESSFKDFILNVGVNIFLPFDSLVWPGYTLMHIVVTILNDAFSFLDRYENLSLLKILLNHDVDLSIKDAHGRNPLLLAFSMEKKFHVQNILDSYNEKSIKSFSNEENALNLQIACITNCVRQLEKLISYGIDPNVTIDNNTKVNSKLINHCSSLYHITLEKSYSSEDIIKILDKANARLDLLDSNGLTCIHKRILNEYSNANDWIHDVLTKFSSNLNVSMINHTNKYRLSLLHVACWIGNFYAVKTILQITKSHINEQIVCDSSDRYSKELALYLGFTPLHFAIKEFFNIKNIVSIKKFFKIIELLIENKANVNIKNSEGFNALHLTLFLYLTSYKNKYHESILKMLVQEFDKNNNTWQSDFGLTRLHIACYMNDLTVINNLLQSGIKTINKQIDLKSPIWPGDTPLHVLLNNSSFEKSTVKLLIDHGADVNIKNIKGQTPFHFMLYKKVFSEEDDYFYILERDNICNLNLCDNDGVNYFHLSCLQNNEIVEKFLKLGVDVNKSVNCSSLKYPGYTPLHFAVQNKNELVIQLLIKYNANLCIEDSFGRTPLHFAAKVDPELFKYLLSDDKKKIIQCKNVFGETALDVLIDYYFPKSESADEHVHLKHLGYCKILLDHDICMNFFNPFRSRYNLAALVASFDSNTFELLIEKSTDLMNIDSDGQNLIHKIILDPNFYYNDLTRSLRNVELLISKTGIDINFKDKYGKTALHKSIEEKNFWMIKGLIDLGADINILDDQENNIQSFDFQSIMDYINEYRSNYEDFLKFHMIKLYYLDFYLRPSIRKIVESKVNDFQDYYLETVNTYELELKLMENEKVIDSVSLRDVLRKNFVEKFFNSLMTEVDRKLILEKLYSDSLWLDFEEFGSLLKLQLRKIEKIKKRKKLINLATDFLWNILDLPVYCIALILEYLNDEDLQSLCSV